MPDIALIKAGTAEIEVIRALARVTWNQHYTSIITQEQIDYMLELMYSYNSLYDQIVNKGHIFYFIRLNKEDIGFISVTSETDGNWFINKFYVDQRHAGKGVGTGAFTALEKLIRPKKITLTVNRQNFKSVNFYFKMGFKIERVADFDIGNSFVMNDFVMVWKKPVS